MLEYKGYVGYAEFDDESDIFYGEVINTRDVITFQDTSVRELNKSFKDSVDDYLEFCKSRNEKPDKPFSGTFNLRLDPELHREAFIKEKKSGCSLNSWVKDTIKKAVGE